MWLIGVTERMKFNLLCCYLKIDKDAIVVCHDNTIEIVDLRGTPKVSKKFGISELEFDFRVDGIGMIQ